MSNSERKKLSNSEFLNTYLSSSEEELQADKKSRYQVLPHESHALAKEYDNLLAKRGGENRRVRLDRISSFIGASIVDYPESDETRVTIGSRVRITEDGDEPFTLDIVGVPEIYPVGLIDISTGDEIQGMHMWSLLARTIIGHKVGEKGLVLGAGEGAYKVTIESLDQDSVQSYFTSNPLSFTLE